MTKILSVKNLAYAYASDSKLSASGYSISVNDFALNKGEVVAITGVSGCGKSTLLECLGLIRDDFKAQSYSFLNFDLLNMPASSRFHVRSSLMSYMPQSGGLIPYLNIQDNIRLKIKVSGQELARLGLKRPLTDSQLFERACDLADMFSLSDKLTAYPESLSIGQRQRAVFFKTISCAPALILIDEPTSSLDPEHSEVLFDTIITACKEWDTASLVVTHDLSLVAKNSLASLCYTRTGPSSGAFYLEESCS